MLTYQLVQPSFIYMKLSSLFCAVPFSVNISTGELHKRHLLFFQVGFRIHLILAVLKLLQLSISAFHLSKVVGQSLKTVETTVVVTLLLFLVATAIVWGSELNKIVSDNIILLRPLRNEKQLHDYSCAESQNTGEFSCEHDAKCGNKFISLLAGVFRRYCLATLNDIIRLRHTFSIHDALAIVVPVALASFLPVVYISIFIGRPEAALAVSVLNPEMKEIAALRIATTVFDIIVATFISMTMQFTIFGLCAFLALYTRELRNLEHMSRFSNGRRFTTRKINHIWAEIRRLSIIFNMFNQCSTCFYAGKILVFAGSVIGTFYLLRFGFQGFVSLLAALIASQSIMFWHLCLGKAYVIPDSMNNVLDSMKSMPLAHTSISRRELKQRIKSTRAVALREGGFRETGRETSPEFFDFYVNQVIALVLAFN